MTITVRCAMRCGRRATGSILEVPLCDHCRQVLERRILQAYYAITSKALWRTIGPERPGPDR